MPGARILIVEDEPQLRSLLRLYLEGGRRSPPSTPMVPTL